MLSDILRWGGKRPGQSGPAEGSEPAPAPAGPARASDPIVASRALPKFLSALGQRESTVLIDFGPVIGSNVSFFGERLGCKLFIEDLPAEYDRHARAGTLDALAASLDKRFRHEDQSVDGVLCWDFFDFLDKSSAQALARHIVRLLRPGGVVMGFFCTAAVAHAPFTKYEVIDEQSLRHRAHAGHGGPKHALLNRDIIKMFDGLIVSDSYLLKSNTREIVLRRANR
jgi:methyltransferase family protein